MTKHLNIYKIAILLIFLAVAGIVVFGRLKNKKNTAFLQNSLQKIDTIKYQVYKHTDPKFSVSLPKDFVVSSFSEGEGQMVLIKQKDHKENKEFQIYITPFDEPGPITPERIKKDLPDMVVEDPKEVLIGKDKNLRALIFFSKSGSLGKTREVWFVQNGNLYQVTGYAALDVLIGTVLDTLSF